MDNSLGCFDQCWSFDYWHRLWCCWFTSYSHAFLWYIRAQTISKAHITGSSLSQQYRWTLAGFFSCWTHKQICVRFVNNLRITRRTIHEGKTEGTSKYLERNEIKLGTKTIFQVDLKRLKVYYLKEIENSLVHKASEDTKLAVQKVVDYFNNYTEKSECTEVSINSNCFCYSLFIILFQISDRWRSTQICFRIFILEIVISG